MKERVREKSVETGKFLELERRGREVVSSWKPGRNRNGAQGLDCSSCELFVSLIRDGRSRSSLGWLVEGKEFFGTAHKLSLGTTKLCVFLLEARFSFLQTERISWRTNSNRPRATAQWICFSHLGRVVVCLQLWLFSVCVSGPMATAAGCEGMLFCFWTTQGSSAFPPCLPHT